MKKHLPALFFILACALNLCGRFIGADSLAYAVKPALIPLLSIATAVYALDHRMDRRLLETLLAAQLFGFAGDLLIRGKDAVFLSGMGAFLIGHILYMALFCARAWKGLAWWEWIICLGIMGGGLYYLTGILGIDETLLIPMVVYGLALLLLVFGALCGLIRLRDKGTYLVILFGTLLFLASDTILAGRMFGVLEFEQQGLVIMATYLAAQSFLSIGGFRLARKD